MTRMAANSYAAITPLRAIIPLAAPARMWARTGLGSPAAWPVLALLLAAHAGLSLDGLAATGLLILLVRLRLGVRANGDSRSLESRDALLRAMAAHEPALHE